jgi:ADP-ribose pyrophosphatase YjhB (NUDIX family)
MINCLKFNMVKLGMYNIVVKTVIFKNNEVLILKRSDYQKDNAFENDLPGGRLESHEDPKEVIIRETFEETNVNIKLKNCYDCFYFFSKSENVDKVSLMFVSEYKNGKLKTSFEHESAKWYDINNLPKEITPWVLDTIQKAIKFKNI